MSMMEPHREFYSIPNLYSPGSPLYDAKMFYGRKAEMAFLRDNLARDTKTIIVLYGHGRAGKTTLLLQVVNEFAHTEHIAVLIDMQYITYRMTLSSFLYKAALTISHAMQKKQISILLPGAADFKLDPAAAFGAFLDCVEDQLTGQKLILMVDEYETLEEQFVRGKLNTEIFEYLRAIFQHRVSINFLFSGIHKMSEYTKWHRAAFLKNTCHYRLSRIDPQGARDLIQKPVEGFLKYESLSVKKIRHLTADQPYLIHLICRAIVDYCNDRRKTSVHIHDVDVVLREVMPTIHSHFDWLWSQLSPQKRSVLSVLAKGNKNERRWLSFDEMLASGHNNHSAFKHEYLLDSLTTLIDADIIEVKPVNFTTLASSRFRIAAGLMQHWLQEEKPGRL